jgi:hypothetical protein
MGEMGHQQACSARAFFVRNFQRKRTIPCNALSVARRRANDGGQNYEIIDVDSLAGRPLFLCIFGKSIGSIPVGCFADLISWSAYQSVVDWKLCLVGRTVKDEEITVFGRLWSANTTAS